MIATKDNIGIGIYTPAEAAFYARVQTQMLNRWFFGSSQGDSVVATELQSGRDVTFLDFVQALAIRNLRTRYKIPLPKIRQAYNIAREHFGVEFPFAMQHTTYLFSDQARLGHGDLVIRIPNRRSGGEPEELYAKYYQLSGRSAHNRVMREVVELYIEDLTFKAGIASHFKAWQRDGGTIAMDPRIRFGAPVVESCGYTAETLSEASVLEGGLDAAARAYGVERQDVALAVQYLDHLQGKSSL